MHKSHDVRKPKGIPVLKNQSSMEFFSIYGFALVSMAIIISIIYVFAIVPNSAVPNRCNFPGYITCKQIAIASNTVASRATFILTNAQEYAVSNVIATVNITGEVLFKGPCLPDIILPGGIIECVINANNGINQNQITAGSLKISEFVCTQPTNIGCVGPVSQAYVGTFSASVVPLS